MINFSTKLDIQKLKNKMEASKLNQEALAKLVGVTSSQISHLINNRRSPSWETLYKIAEVLQIDPRELLDKDASDQHALPIRTIRSKIFPLLTVSQIEEWLYNPVLQNYHRMIQMAALDREISPKTFLFEVIGTTMVNQNNHSKSLSPGEQVLVEPEVIPKSGQLVLVKFGENDVRIRQFQEDGARKFFKTFEPNLPIEIVEESHVILGTIIKAGSWRDIE